MSKEKNRILNAPSTDTISCSHVNNVTTNSLVTEAKNLDVILSFNDFNLPTHLDPGIFRASVCAYYYYYYYFKLFFGCVGSSLLHAGFL